MSGGELASRSHLSQIISKFRPDLNLSDTLYRSLHADPELSRYEAKTASLIANSLQSLAGLDVRSQIGGHGVVGILRNGDGPTVMLRAELDALPVLEQTGLPYASNKLMSGDANSPQKPVMHACGHDMHMTALLASAELLHKAQQHWNGTVIFLFQPDEENGAGAQRMVEDGLYDVQKHAVPHPDIVLAGHVMPMRSGSISTRPGVFNCASESFRITLYGRGGHGGKPHTTIDTVVLACSIVMNLQTIVSRETDPQDACVVTVGSIRSGEAANVIPGEAIILVNTRAFNETSRIKLRESISRIVHSQCSAFGSPKAPLIEKISTFPLLFNDISATTKIAEAMTDHFNSTFSLDAPISTGSEDLANLANPVSAPVCFWTYGGVDPKAWDEAVQSKTLEKIPGNVIPSILIPF